ncbi:hypothetical protein, partial [Bacillus altitudinis]
MTEVNGANGDSSAVVIKSQSVVYQNGEDYEVNQTDNNYYFSIINDNGETRVLEIEPSATYSGTTNPATIDIDSEPITFDGPTTLKEIRDALSEKYSGVKAWSPAENGDEATRDMLVVTDAGGST